jgi:hypothetical protein
LVCSKSEPEDEADRKQEEVYAIEECYVNLDEQENQDPSCSSNLPMLLASLSLSAISI